MTIREFEVLTGFHPSTAHYEVIEQDYNSSQLDKYEYCEAYKADKDGIAERLARLADKCAWERDNKHADELKASFTEIKLLHDRLAEAKAQLDRELDWHPATDIGTNMSEHDYQLLADDEPPLSELDAIRHIYEECGFDMAHIKIVKTVNTYDVNKHHKCRISGEFSRLPVWSSTDWNYIRFDVAGLQWELVNGDLRQYYD